ncbi:glycoside hydrolase family 131 protein [Lentithecium fluviatile CBS 122367]|uniref:Glycoside hydrolase family 131 protein n=1 Tax=Lentithecium fluviatile CBS 122367 TaxID=1168545 RepID=A0A6G1IEI4_9PLEO|nr:glycoside hydrolase family 131 protein [Lentithecium fluviatile CBS 122367]
MHILTLLQYVALASALPRQHHSNPINCPIIFDGRIPQNLTLASFDSAATSPYSPTYVKGENLTWSQILLLSNQTPPSRFDNPTQHKPIEVTINDASLFHSGAGLQIGFRRAGLLLKDDKNAAGADSADEGAVTFHWSVRQDAARPLNLSHEYMNVWHEKADYSGNQFSFVGGVVLKVDGGTGEDSPEEREKWRVQNARNEFIFETKIRYDVWQNFAVRLDYVNSTIQVFYSSGQEPLKEVTMPLPNENSGGGQLQLGIAKKPTETETVVWDGYQEAMPKGEGQIYGGVFVEKSSDGCVSR